MISIQYFWRATLRDYEIDIHNTGLRERVKEDLGIIWKKK